MSTYIHLLLFTIHLHPIFSYLLINMRLLSATCFLVCFSGTLIAAKEVTLNDGLANALLDWALRDLTLTPLQNTDGYNILSNLKSIFP